jgi:methionyl-tRNA formyltransferase
MLLPPMAHRALVLAEETWISARALAAWLAAGHEVAAVWCGSGSSLLRPLHQPIARAFPGWSARQVVRRHGVPLERCPPLRHWAAAVDRAKETRADVLLNLLGLQIIPDSLLDHFGGRALNVHPALLPLYRGPCPRIAMIADGRADEAGGVCVHVLTSGIDEGPIVATRAVPLSTARDYADWDARLALAAADLVRAEVMEYLAGHRPARPQDETQALYRKPGPGELDIGQMTPLAHARRLEETLGSVGRLVCKPPVGTTRRSTYRVTRIVRVIGPPEGRPPQVGFRSLTLDIADARVMLARRGLHDRLRVQLDLVKALRRRSEKAR